MKWWLAVGIGSGRPGNAWPGAGISAFFLNMNMEFLPPGHANVQRQYRHWTDHPHPGAPSRIGVGELCGATHRKRSAPGVADERPLFPPKQNENGAENAEHEPRGLFEHD